MNADLAAVLDAARRLAAARVGGRAWVVDGELTAEQRAEIAAFRAAYPDAWVILQRIVDAVDGRPHVPSR